MRSKIASGEAVDYHQAAGQIEAEEGGRRRESEIDRKIALGEAKDRKQAEALIEDARTEVRDQVKELARIYVHGRPANAEIQQRIEMIKEASRRAGEEPPADLDFYEGETAHTGANEQEAVFRGSLSKEAKVRFNKTADQLTRQEVEQIYAAFPGRKALEDAEFRTMRLYDSWLHGQHQSGPAGSLTVESMISDLRWRRAERLTDPAKREKALGAIEKDAQRLIHMMGEMGEEKGKIAEHQLIWMIKRWSRTAGIDHLVSAEHETLRNDLRNLDMVLYLGDRQRWLDQKTWTSGTKLEEVEADDLKQAADKVAARGGSLAQIEPVDLRQAWAKEMEGKTSPARRRIVDALAAILPEQKVLIDRLKPEAKKPPKYTEADVQKYLSPDRLIALGLLTKEDTRDVGKIAGAKKLAMVEALKLLRVKDEDRRTSLDQADFADRLRGALEALKK